MGSQQPLFVSLGLKGMVLENQGKSYKYGALWNKPNMIITSRKSGEVAKNRRSSTRSRALKKRGTRTRIQSARRRGNAGIHRRVKTLKRLIPTSDSSMGLDGLFRETADYILSLQSRVRLMQVMVQALESSASEDHE